MMKEEIGEYLTKLEEEGVITPKTYEDENVRIHNLAWEMEKVHKLTEEEIEEALKFELRKLKKRFSGTDQ